MLFSAIHHTFGPHVDDAYLRKVLRMSYAPWRYREGKSRLLLASALGSAFGADAIPFASGREALLALLQALRVQPGDEIILQGYTCMVLPNAIHAAGCVPVYADIDEHTLNLTVESVAAVLSPKTKAVICQHTFGLPAPTAALRRLCDERKLLLIEDCAHVLPDTRGPADIGKLGDFCLLSFGRDKAISGIAGGAIVSRHADVTKALRERESRAPHLPFWTVLKLLEYAPRMRNIVRPFMGSGLAKPYLWLIRKLGWMVPVLEDDERQGKMDTTVRKLPNACAFLALHSWKALQQSNDHRRLLARSYAETATTYGWNAVALALEKTDLPLQKFPLFLPNAEAVRRALKRKNIHLDDGWTGCVVCPANVNLPASGYVWGSDPEAEKVCTSILSLPTHPTMTLAQARYVVACLHDVLRRTS